MLAEKLRASGLRVTPQRRAVWSAFEGRAGAHLTAEEVCERARRAVPELSRATAYNALADLARVGLLRIIEDRGVRRYDPNPDPDHQHFRCRSCGTLHDVRPTGLASLSLPHETGFVVERLTVLFEGLCPECAL